MKLWVDDLRPAPEGWRWAKNSETALAALALWQSLGCVPDEISFDHDLGDDDTTRPVVLWLAEHGTWPKVCRVHTANPVGREWLEGMINRYGPGVTQ